MNNVMFLMKAFGLTPDEKGVCHGCAVMALQAFVIGEYGSYRHRLKRVNAITKAIVYRYPSALAFQAWKLGTRDDERRRDILKTIVESVYPGVSDVFVDMRIFLEGVAFFQAPANYTVLFDSKAYVRQHEVEKAAVVGQSFLAEKKGGIKRVASFSGVYSKAGMDVYLCQLQAFMVDQKHKGSRCALLLYNDWHAIMLAYRTGASAAWFIDNNGQATVLSQDSPDSFKGIEIFEAFYRTTHNDKPLILSTAVYSTGAFLEEAIDSFNCLTASAPWKHLHAITSEKAKQRDGTGASWLYFAVRYGHTELVNQLIVAGAAVDQINKKCTSAPLFTAAQEGYPEIVERLLAEGVSVDQTNKCGTTPLLIALYRRHSVIVDQLLAAGAQVDALIKAPMKLLRDHIVAQGRTEALEILLKKLTEKGQKGELLNAVPLELMTYFDYSGNVPAFLRSKGVYVGRKYMPVFIEWLITGAKYPQQAIDMSDVKFAETAANILSTYVCSTAFKKVVVEKAIEEIEEGFDAFKDYFNTKLKPTLEIRRNPLFDRIRGFFTERVIVKGACVVKQLEELMQQYPLSLTIQPENRVTLSHGAFSS